MKIRPLYDHIVVKRIEEQETVKGGIMIPDTAKEKPQRFGSFVGRMTLAISAGCSAKMSYIVDWISSDEKNAIEALDCGSRSIRSVLFFLSASAAAKLMDVVVFPTPPF